MRRQDLSILMLAGLLGTGAEARAVAPLDLRTLPTVVKVWGRAMAAERLTAHHEVLYVKDGGRVTALAVRSGREVWSRDLGEEGCCSDDMLVTDATVITSADGSLFLLSAADG
ncbi:MAG TPA: PQQ-binding-like beta-propeller repeat protein, partial [Thermoanaerobaculia bacterium]|nr:PQQ-binding-like beta-propeller repeat protein [Thermoanaerobaculia bacterium]